MMMVEVTSVPSAALPVAELADYLRLSSGFADDGSQNARLETCLRAACAAIEARIGKALFQRDFALTLPKLNKAQPLPVAPAQAVDSVKLIDTNGGETIVDPATYLLRRDIHRPQVVAKGSHFPSVPQEGTAEIAFTAGFAVEWSGIPSDLQQAALSLAGTYYTQDHDGPMPGAVTAILAPYRHVRVGAGA